MPGHVIVIGLDYQTSTVAADRLLGNAVFVARGADVHVLVHGELALPSQVANVAAAIDRVAREIGRSWSRHSLAANAPLAPQLAQADVLVIAHQARASDQALRSRGASWKIALDDFVRRGGVIISLDGPAHHRGTYQLLQAAGLFDAKEREPATGATLSVADAGDAVALGVPYLLARPSSTMRFIGVTDAPVVVDEVGPVVIHASR
jgi:hypothetical protein